MYKKDLNLFLKTWKLRIWKKYEENSKHIGSFDLHLTLATELDSLCFA